MTTVELTSSEPPSLEGIVAALGDGFGMSAGEPVVSERIYLDTFDGLVRVAERTLAFEDGRLTLTGDDDGVGLGAAFPGVSDRPLPGGELPAGALRDAVLSLIDVRALLPLARVSVSTQRLAILDELEKTVVRAELVIPALAGAGGVASRRAPLTARVRLRGVRGYEGELRVVRKALSAALGLKPAAQSLFEEALLAAGLSPDGVSAKIDVALDPGERTDVAAARVLRRLLEVMDTTLPGTLAGVDSEFLHDYRVAVRRTRSVQRELSGAFPREPLVAMRAEFKWLQEVTGDARDLDVYLLGFPEMRGLVPEAVQDDLAPLETVLRHRRADARRRMVRTLRSDRVAAVRGEWSALLDALASLPEDDRPDASRPIGEVAGERIRKVYRRMVRMGSAIGDGSPPEDYHELRKKGKELRYLLELFGAPLHDAAVVKPMVKALKNLQDVLGRHQDREIQTAMLRSLTSEVSALPGGDRALLAMGVLIERLDEDAAAARGEFAAHFAEFAGAETRARVKQTFA